jgi:cyclophilin family peptidyl-prolyl cis-trans isomerase
MKKPCYRLRLIISRVFDQFFLQGGDLLGLMAAFNEEGKDHAAMPPEAFNDDHVYKQNLNQVHDHQ